MDPGRTLKFALIPGLLLLVIFSMPAGSLRTATAPTAEELKIRQDLLRKKQDLVGIERKIQQQNNEQARTLKREKDVLFRLEKMDREIERLDRVSVVNQQDLKETRVRIGEQTLRSSEATRRLFQNRIDLRKRLRALYRAGTGNNLLTFWLGSKAPGEVSRELKFGMLLARSNEKLLNQTLQDQQRLEDATRGLNQEQRRRERILQALQLQKEGNSRQRTDRANLLVSLRQQQVLREQALRDLRNARGDLQSTVNTLLKQAVQARQEAQIFNAGKGLGLLKRKLPWPIKGTVLSPFGRYKSKEFNTTFENSGIQIKAPAGAPVKAISGGKVRYADWFKGFGKLVILDHGEGYYSLYAQASEIYVSDGDLVVGGQVVASVGDTGSLVGNALYFELRKNGLAIDPIPWLKR